MSEEAMHYDVKICPVHCERLLNIKLENIARIESDIDGICAYRACGKIHFKSERAKSWRHEPHVEQQCRPCRIEYLIAKIYQVFSGLHMIAKVTMRFSLSKALSFSAIHKYNSHLQHKLVKTSFSAFRVFHKERSNLCLAGL